MIFCYIASFFCCVLQHYARVCCFQHGLSFSPVGVDGDARFLHQTDELVAQDGVVVEQCRLRFPDETADSPEEDGLALPCHVLRGGGQRPASLLWCHPGTGHRVAGFHLTREASVVLVVLLGEPSGDHV